jgi:hypothetical protein
MSIFYQVFAHVYPGQCSRVLVHTHILPIQAPTLPAPSLASFGNFITLRRSFTAPEQAEAWACLIRSGFAQGLVKSPILDGGQIELFNWGVSR